MSGEATSNGSEPSSLSSKTTNEHILAEMLDIIRSHPGIRPSELNRLMKREQSDSLRAALIRKGLVRKVKDGQATHLYAR